MNLSSFNSLQLQRQGRVLTATLASQAEHLNPIGQAGHAELIRFFREVSVDRETDIVVLTGSGRAFCGGHDMAYLDALVQQPGSFDLHAAKQLMFTILDCPKLLVAKVNGHALGLGATLALSCDVIFAAAHAKFGDLHVAVGSSAADGGALLWPQLAGFARAKEALLTGDLLPADEAARMGLINHSVPASELDARVDAFVARLAAGAMKALQWTKVAVNIGLKQQVHTALDASVAYGALSVHTRDHREAVSAFREKRRPVFIGE